MKDKGEKIKEKSFDIKDKRGKIVFTVKMGNEENPRSQIYIKGGMFMTCHFVPINIPTDELEKTNEIESINDLIDNMDRTNEGEPPIPIQSYRKYKEVAAELDFFVNCSNLQAWVEYDYDTRLLDYKLSFPLLKALAEYGDPLAQQRFKEEVIKRYTQGSYGVRSYISGSAYLHYFRGEERLFFYQAILEEKEGLGVYQLECFLQTHLRIFNLNFQRGILTDMHANSNGLLEIKNKRVVGLQILESPSPKLWDFIRSFSKLQQLNLSGNVTYIPDWISELKSLESLKIQNSDLERLPSSIGGLINLQYLRLNNNEIKKIPKTIGNLTHLKFLDLSNNNYDSLPNELLDLKNLRIFEYDRVKNLPEDIDYIEREIMKRRGYYEKRFVGFSGIIEHSWLSIEYLDSENSIGKEVVLKILKPNLKNLISCDGNLRIINNFITKEIFPRILEFTNARAIQSRNVFLEFYEKKIKKILKENDLKNKKISDKALHARILEELKNTISKNKEYITITSSFKPDFGYQKKKEIIIKGLI